MTALIDLDSQVYAAGFAGEHKFRTVFTWYGKKLGELEKGERVNSFCKKLDVSPEEVQIQTRTELEPLANVLHTAKLLLQGIIDGCQQDDYEIFLTEGDCFRKEIYKDYKHSRDKLEKPHYYHEIRQYYIDYFDAYVAQAIEADDKVCMRAYALEQEDKEHVIASVDKDLLQIPGYHYNPKKPEDGVFLVDPWEADFNFYCQLLTGDSVDDIPGINGIGPVKAKKLLSGCDDERDMYSLCCVAYASTFSYKNWQDIMHRNAHLLYLLRYPNDAWQPPVEV